MSIIDNINLLLGKYYKKYVRNIELSERIKFNLSTEILENCFYADEIVENTIKNNSVYDIFNYGYDVHSLVLKIVPKKISKKLNIRYPKTKNIAMLKVNLVEGQAIEQVNVICKTHTIISIEATSKYKLYLNRQNEDDQEISLFGHTIFKSDKEEDCVLKINNETVFIKEFLIKNQNVHGAFYKELTSYKPREYFSTIRV